jgi:S1-C subfamily serine protease
MKDHSRTIIAFAAGAFVLAILFAAPPVRGQLLEDERNTIEIVKSTKNSVVFVTNIGIVRDPFFFGEEKAARGSGSGFVWDERGHIVTNFHVIEDGVEYKVTLPNREERTAKLIGKDEIKDIAVLKVEGDLKGLFPVRAGTSENLQVGQKVIAIGNPFGFDHTVTTGIVSALGRSIPGAGGLSIRDMIQTDASINPGNSGGPLLNSAGELIGMNAMIISPSGASSGVGFAVPVDTIKKLVPELIRYGRVTWPTLPVRLLSDDYARRLGVREPGVVIYQVPEGGEAAKAGLQGLSRDRRGYYYLGDVITAVDGAVVKSNDDLFSQLESRKVGETVTLTVTRNGKARQVRVKLVRD